MNKPSTSASPVELARRLSRTWEAVQPLISRSLVAEGLDARVRPGMGLVLFALVEEDGRLIGDIARRGHVSHVAALQLVTRLEKAGLVRRKDCPDDGRATRVWLTPTGRALEGKLLGVSARNHEALVKILGRSDAIKLNDLLGRLLDGLAAENSAASAAISRHKSSVRRKANNHGKARR